MAKVLSTTNISPTVFMQSMPITQESLRELVEHQNWVRNNRRKTYLNLCCSTAADAGGWDSGDGQEISTLGIEFPPLLDPIEIRIDQRIITADHVTSLKVGARCTMALAGTGTVRFRYFKPPGSSVYVDLAFSVAENGTEVTDDLDISSVKDNGSDTEARIQILIITNTGVVPGFLRNIRVMDDVSSATPDPVF